MFKWLSLFIFVIALGLGNTTHAQCGDELVANCATGSENLKYIKHFKIRFAEAPSAKKRSEGNFTLMLMKGNHYRFFACNDETKAGRTLVELSSDFGQFGGNFNGETGKEYRAFDFVCTKTGPYYLKMFFRDGKEGCGVCVVSLVMD